MAPVIGADSLPDPAAASGAEAPSEHHPLIDDRLTEVFAQLSRDPDFDAEELQAFDAADHLIVRTAATAVPDLIAAPGNTVIIGDRHGALTLGLATLGATAIRTHQDPLLGERALAQNADRLGLSARFSSHELNAELLSGARLVLLQLPRGLDALDEIATAIARWAAPDVRVFAGGRVKHMTRTMNDVLARSFVDVSAGLGWRKSRVLTASSPRPVVARDSDAISPRWGDDAALDFRLAAFGATFGGPVLDHGSRLLLDTLVTAPPEATQIVDLGCGNGVLAVTAARTFPTARVIATDQSMAAVAATYATAEAAGVEDRIDVRRADALEAVPDAWADLILLNPPFHTGATVHAGVGQRLIRACRRALAPGGELRLVFNSHLPYRSIVEREIGPAQQLARTATFTVLAARRR